MTYWSRSFQGLPENLSEVRRFTAAVLGDRPGVDLVVLVASELAGNAILHSASGQPGGQFVVHVAAFADRWQIRVDDEGGLGEPILSPDPAGDDAEDGRGLALIAAVSRSWGVLGNHYARAVWAEIPHPSPAEARAAGKARTGDALQALEAALDAVAAETAERPPILALQSPDSPAERPASSPPGAADETVPADPLDGPGTTPDTSPETAPDTAPATTPKAEPARPAPDDDPPIRRSRDTEPCGLPSRARLRAAGVTELEAMLIEMAYAETVGRA